MQAFEDFYRNGNKKAFDAICAWKEKHKDIYSKFVIDMAKVAHGDYTLIERVFKMAVQYVPLPVLEECQKLFVPSQENCTPTDNPKLVASSLVDDLMALKGYLTFGMFEEEADGKSVLIKEIGISEVDLDETDEDRIYMPLAVEEDFWESLPPFLQLAVFCLGKGHTTEELSNLVMRISVAVFWFLPRVLRQLRQHIVEEKDPLLMCALYYIMCDHGFVKFSLLLGNIDPTEKQASYVREGIKAMIDKMVETSLTRGYDKKSEWSGTEKKIEDKEFERIIDATLAQTKGKRGRHRLQQDSRSLDDILIGNKEKLKSELQIAFDEMEHDTELAYIFVALRRSNHLEDVAFPTFFHAASAFANKKFAYDRAGREARRITSDRKLFETSVLSKDVQGRKLVNRLVTKFFQTD